MPSVVNGENVILYKTVGGVDTVFGAATNCTFDVSVDQVEVTSQTSAYFREYKIDVAGWTVNCDGLISLTGYSYKDMLDSQLAKSTIGIKFSIYDVLQVVHFLLLLIWLSWLVQLMPILRFLQ